MLLPGNKYENPEAYEAYNRWIKDSACATREDAYISGWAAGFERGHIMSVTGPPEITADEAEYMNGYRHGYAVVKDSAPETDISGRSAAWQYGYRSGRDVARGDVTAASVGLPDDHPDRLPEPADPDVIQFAWSTGYVDARNGRPFTDDQTRPDAWQYSYRAGFDAGIEAESGETTT